MTPWELLSELERRGVRLDTQKGQLRYRASTGSLTPELRAAMAAHKEAILALLAQRDAASATSEGDWSYVKDKCLHELFETHASRTPDALAAVYGDEQITYGELNRKANQGAHFLRSLGIGLDVPVPICVDRGVRMLVGKLAILKSGGVYLPLDPGYPRERLESILDEIEAPILVAQESVRSKLPDRKMWCLDSDWSAVQSQSRENPSSGARAENLAYMMYTSGSTGRPKGVLVPHQAITRLVCGTDYIRFTPNDAVAQVSTPTFDAATFEIWGALLNGGRLTGIAKDVLLSPEELASAIREQDISVLLVTTALFNQVALDLPSAFAPVETLLFGGEAANPSRVRRVLSAAPPRRLINAYGPTEAGVISTIYPVHSVGEDDGTVPIGRPIANTEAQILDRNGNVVPVGVPGELCVGGPGVARGYFRRPGLTAEKFVPDPLSQAPGRRLYRTGDVCRWLASGAIEYVGRADHQVKLRGVRIELGELETAMREHPAIREAVALLREDTPGDKRLVAYFVADPEYRASETDDDQAADRVEKWREVYDQVVYPADEESSKESEDPTFNITGWRSTYTNEPIGSVGMGEQIGQTVARIKALGPKRVLEVGCGTGLLLFRLAPECDLYWGTDFSEVALAHTREWVERRGLRGVRLEKRLADDFRGFSPSSFDAVVLNSVVQYFPNAEYLVQVLEGALDVVAPGGSIFLGDVRNLAVLDAFQASVQLYQARDSMSRDALKRRVEAQLRQEQELSIDPAFFFALQRHLPRIRHLEIRPKRGHHQNELMQFRYDVTLHVGGEGTALQVVHPDRWLDWDEEGLSVEGLRTRLEESREALIGVRRVPNARVASAVRTLELLSAEEGPETAGELRRAATEARGIDPEDLWSLSEELPYRVEISWAGGSSDGRFDGIFWRRGLESSNGTRAVAEFPSREEKIEPWSHYTSNPLRPLVTQSLIPELRKRLAEKLPDQMMPSAFVALDELPLTSSGKLDRKALPAPGTGRPELQAGFLPPRTPAEEALARIWSEVLGVQRVGVFDDFFELGGDSILSIQVVARARQAGLNLSPRQFFQHQTIAALAAVAEMGEAAEAQQGVVTGRVPLTPIQRWFFEQRFPERHHFNQAALLDLGQRVDPRLLERVVRALLTHHDALRLRYQPEGEDFRQLLGGVEENAVFRHIDLSAEPAENRDSVLEEVANGLQRSLNLSTGPLVRAALFSTGTGSDRLLIVVHHLAVDGVSWRILLEDLWSGYQQLTVGEDTVQLPAKTTSFQAWAERLEQHARSQAMGEEASYWLELSGRKAPALPVDFVGGENDLASAETVVVTLSADETGALLSDVPSAYRTQINDVLLTALAQAFRSWTGESGLLLELEGHGREELFDDVDLSRTVGWFTTIFPVWIEIEGAAGIAEALKKVKEQLRRIPRKGIGYGLLRYLRGDEELSRQLVSRAEVSFNYLGQFHQSIPEGLPVRLVTGAGGALQSDRGERSHLIEINGGVIDGRLQMVWSYSRRFHKRETMERLADGFLDSLRGIVSHCLSEEAGGCTPSDFPMARIDQPTLDRLLGKGRHVEDLYPLSPLQSGILFHSLYAPETRMYLEQLSCKFEGDFEVEAFQRSWDRLIERHPILRTAFVWQGIGEPLQVVYRQVSLAWEQRDFRELSPAEQQSRLESFLEADRNRGLKLDEAPIVRMALFRLADDLWWFNWSHHHILLDGWSLSSLLKELVLLYESSVRGVSAPLPRPRPYREYIEWWKGQDSRAAEGFWRETLRGFDTPTALLFGRAPVRDAAESFGEAELALSEAATSALTESARAHQWTVNTLVQGAWALLLSRYGGGEDVVYGTTVSGRSASLPGIESMVGLFINTLPVRARMDRDQTVESWLRGLQEQLAAARQYEHSPLAKVHEWSEVPRGMPLFETLVVYENYPVDSSLRGRGGSVAVKDVHLWEQIHYPLVLVVAPLAALRFRLMYDARRFDRDTAARILRHLEVLLEGFVQNFAAPVSDLSVLTEAERQQVLEAPSEVPGENELARAAIHEVFEAQVRRTPDAVAVQFETHALTYRDLDRRANQLAHHLRALGVGPEVLVGICVERSMEMMVGLLGILKAGGAYLPLDPEYPAERLSFMLEDSGVPVVVSVASLRKRLPEQRARLVLLDADREAIETESAETPSGKAAAERLAYVIYTSGSTGRPKGVGVTHANVVRLFATTRSDYEFGSDDVWTLFHSYAFDFSVWEMWGALFYGGRLVVVPYWVSRTTESFQQLLIEERVTVLNQTPSAFRQLVASACGPSAGLVPKPPSAASLSSGGQPPERGATAALRNEALGVGPERTELAQASKHARATALRYVIFGGEALDLSSLKPWWERYGDSRPRLVNMYGITETTVHVTYRPLHAGDEGPDSVVGRPLRDLRVYVLDPRGEPVPFGVPGEMFVGGAGLSRGYLGRPELTAQRLVPDSFGGRPGQRLYRTGDLARRKPDGELLFLGRIDHQIQLRGFRIELGEIESVLGQHPSVQRAVVLAKSDRPGHQRLVAYLVFTGNATEEQGEAVRALRTYLEAKLPYYMVPSLFVALEAMPLTPEGKLDRRVLASRADTPSEGSSAAAAPRTALEETLSEIWRELLGVERVSTADNFFELGGDSILSIQLVARALEKGIRLTPRQIFEHPTIAELALVAGTGSGVAAEQGLLTGALPLTPIQRWFFEQELPEPHHFNQSLLFEVGRPLMVSYLREAVERLLQHHDALRLRFAEGEAGWEPSLAGWNESDIDAVFSSMDLSQQAESARASALEEECGRLQESLSLERGPLMRVAHFSMGGGPDRLLIAVHHLAVDGVSWRILLVDLLTAYEQRSRGQSVQLPPKTTSYREWSNKLNELARSASLREEAEYWREVGRRPAAALPLDKQSGPNLAASLDAVVVQLSAQETQALLHEVPQAYRTQINDVLLTALVEAFGSWTGHRSVLLDLEGHGREELFEDVDLTRTVGWFTSLFPVHLDLEGAEGPGEALKSVKEQLRRIPRRGIGYGLLRYLGAEPELAGTLASIKPEVSFNYLGQLDQVLPEWAPLQMASESSGPGQSPRAARVHLLDVHGSIRDGQLSIGWNYCSNLHQRRTIERLANDFIESLRALIRHCQSEDVAGYTPSDFPLVSLEQVKLDALVGRGRAVEDIYPLSPLQSGLLFHSLYAPESGMYVEQHSCTFEGKLDEAALLLAWRRVIERHAVLRTSFHWEGLDEPVQVVRRAAEVPWETDDWRGLPAAEQEDRLRSLARVQRKEGLPLGRAPLLRLLLVRLDHDRWRFLWCHHHLLLDGWSVATVLKEVLIFYGAALGQAQVDLPRPLAYRDYIAWLRAQDWEAAERYWRKYLGGVTRPTTLGVERTTSALTEEEKGYEVVQREVGFTSELERMAREHHLTMNTVVQGAWAVLLSRYGGEREVLFGTVASGRSAPLAGIETILGLLINTLPVRVEVTPTAKLLPWLKDLQLAQAEMRQYEHSPLVQIQQWSGMPRGRALFETLMAYENYPVDRSLERWQGALRVRDIRVDERTNYPITVGAIPGKRLVIRVMYERERYEPVTMSRLVGHLERLLEAMAARPDRALWELPLLTEGERQQVLREYSWTEEKERAGRALHEAIEIQTEATPDRVAVVYEGHHLTYGELNARANQLARHLRGWGVELESCVGIHLERSLELMVGLLGVLKAGGAYVPLDPEYPPDRLEQMLSDAEMGVVLSASACGELRGSERLRRLNVDAEWERVGGEKPSNPRYDTDAEAKAYVIYTSGSTGRPKGAVNSHRGIENRLLWMQEAFAIGPEDRVLQKTPSSFDVSVWEFFWPLMTGARLVMARPGGHRDREYLKEAIGREGVTTIHFVPSMLRAFLEAERLEGLESLKRVICSGEALSADLEERFHERVKGAELHNLYGPTEAAVDVSWWRRRDGSRRTVPIGRAITNIDLYVLDNDHQPASLGVGGELHIGGVGVGRGYLKRPALTAERFRPHPFSEEPGRRLYQTGDRCRWDSDGEIEYLGRWDHQVKLRGFRIELGEIEAALNAHPAVRAAVVHVREDRSEHKRLVAYVVVEPGEQSSNGSLDLRGWLARQVPAHMIPATFVLLDALPLTPSGKVDRKSLPAPDPSGRALLSPFTAPRTPLEEELALLWKEVLGVERVGVHDNFFELGGQSLLAMRLVSRVRERFRVELPLKDLFHASTVAGMAELIEGAERGEAMAAITPLTAPDDSDEILSNIDRLSDEEVRARLTGLLAEDPLALDD
jgi:amino acid adenylation domain-containing protein/non-ribosomal peptide synthase protein (TIGR01720 family)